MKRPKRDFPLKKINKGADRFHPAGIDDGKANQRQPISADQVGRCGCVNCPANVSVIVQSAL